MFRGLACTLVFNVRKASPVYDILKMPRNRSSARSPISKISRSGGVAPKFSSETMISSTMMGGLGDLFNAAVSISFAREVSAMSGDQLKLKDMVVEVVDRSSVGLSKYNVHSAVVEVVYLPLGFRWNR